MEDELSFRVLSEDEKKKLDDNSKIVSDFKQSKLEKEAQKNWDLFYKRNTTNFFKDRHWTTAEFKELLFDSNEVSLILRGDLLNYKFAMDLLLWKASNCNILKTRCPSYKIFPLVCSIAESLKSFKSQPYLTHHVTRIENSLKIENLKQCQ